MKRKILSRYISILFIVTTFMGVFHHHDDLKQHSDCQICIVQSSIADADTPSDVFYLTELALLSEDTKSNLPQFFLQRHNSPLRARSPPVVL